MLPQRDCEGRTSTSIVLLQHALWFVTCASADPVYQLQQASVDITRASFQVEAFVAPLRAAAPPSPDPAGLGQRVASQQMATCVVMLH